MSNEFYLSDLKDWPPVTLRETADELTEAIADRRRLNRPTEKLEWLKCHLEKAMMAKSKLPSK